MARSAQKPKASDHDLVLEEFLPYRLSILSNRVSRAIAARYAEEFDLTIPEWRVMALLGRHAQMTASEIADATEMDKVAISRAVARLTEMRRVAGSPDPKDARRQLLRLSAQGARIYAEIAPVALECERRLLSALSANEKAMLDGLIDRLLDGAKKL